MISRLCACRRDHSDVRRPHRERARHRGGAAAACVARRATEWHAFAVPTLPGGPSYRFSALRGCTAHPVRSFRSRVMAGGMVVDRFSGPSRASTPATGSRASTRRASTFRPSSLQSSCRSLASGQITAPQSSTSLFVTLMLLAFGVVAAAEGPTYKLGRPATEEEFHQPD